MANTKVEYGFIYATQTFKQSYEGDGPFIQMAFMSPRNIPERELTWSKQQSFPSELTLKTINGQVRLCRNPVDGIKQLRYESHFWKNTIINPGENPLADLDGDVLEIIAEIDLAKATGFVFKIRGESLTYNAKEQLLTIMGNQAKLLPADSKIKLRIIIDRSSIEVYADEGEVTFSNIFYPDPSNMKMELFSTGGSVRINSMEAYRLQSIWLKREQELGYYRTSGNK